MAVPQPRVTTHGAFFTSNLTADVRRFLDDVKEDVAERGVNEVKARLGSVLRHPTGFYESRIQTDRVREDQVIHDGGVVYGPWLEGTSRRNQTTRFKGYRTFRTVHKKLDDTAHRVADDELASLVARWNR